MTLSTHINFLEDVDLEQVFAEARKAIGIPMDQPFDIERPIEGYKAPHFWLRSKPGGFNAMLWVERCESGEGDFDEEDTHARYHLDPAMEEPCNCRRWMVQVMLDTAYGFQPCCTCEHYRIIREFAPKLGVPFEWQDEYTGDWFSGMPPLSCSFHAAKVPA